MVEVFAESALEVMNVAFRDGDVGVAEHFFGDFQRSPVFDDIRGERVPEGVGVEVHKTGLMEWLAHTIPDFLDRKQVADFRGSFHLP